MEKSNPISYNDVFILRGIEKGLDIKEAVNEALDESYKLQNNEDFKHFSKADLLNLDCEFEELKLRIGV